MIKLNKTKLLPVAVLAAFSFLANAENGGAAAAPSPAGATPVSTRILKGISSFMMAPTSAWAPIGASGTTRVTVSNEMSTDGNLGFRVIHVKAAGHAQKSTAVDLAASGLVQTGDIFLSFRPEWAGTLAYAHMQLGISHTGLAFVVSDSGGKYIHTLESPMSYSSAMNYAEHYGDLNAIHVIRPTLSDAEKANLTQWAQLALKHQGQLGFYKDYGKPFYKRGVPGVTQPRDQIQHLAKLLNGARVPNFDSYCSEWAWTFLGLRGCSPATYSDDNPDCAKPIFTTGNGALTGIIPGLQGPNAGLIQGAEASLTNGGVANKDAILSTKVFRDVLSNPSDLAGRMSSGHIAVAQANAGLMKTISGQYYGSNPPENPQIAAAINAQVVDNFSPTSFMIRSNAGLDGLHYVGTVVWDGQ